MKVETKFQVGSLAWTMHNNEVVQSEVIKIEIVADYLKPTGSVVNTLEIKDGGFNVRRGEHKLFHSKEELLASL